VAHWKGEAAAEPQIQPLTARIVGSAITIDPSVTECSSWKGCNTANPNRYVRLRSRGALRQIGPRESVRDSAAAR